MHLYCIVVKFVSHWDNFGAHSLSPPKINRQAHFQS